MKVSCALVLIAALCHAGATLADEAVKSGGGEKSGRTLVVMVELFEAILHHTK